MFDYVSTRYINRKLSACYAGGFLLWDTRTLSVVVDFVFSQSGAVGKDSGENAPDEYLRSLEQCLLVMETIPDFIIVG